MGRNTFNTCRRGNVSRRGAAYIWAAALSLAVGVAGRVAADAITVVSGLDNPNDLQMYGGNLYFVDTSTHPNDTLANVSTGGGTSNVLFSGLANYEPDIGGYSGIGNYSVGSTGVFGGYGDYDNTTMFAGNPATGTTQTLASSYGGVYMGQSDGNVYYSSNFRDINAVLTTGGSSTTVASGVWVRGMTTDTTGAYFQDYWSQDILKFSYGTQSVSTLTGPQNASPFATDSGSLYLNIGGGGIDSVAQTGGTPTALISGSVTGYTATNGNVFYTNGNTIEQYSVSAAKSIPLTTIAAGNVTSMTTDGNWLYYSVSNGSAGTVNKVPVAIATARLPPVHILSFGVTWPPNGPSDLSPGLLGGINAFQVSQAFGAHLGGIVDNTSIAAAGISATSNVSALDSAISAMGAKLHPNDLAIIYINTHGTYDPNDSNTEASIQRQIGPNQYTTTSVPTELALQGVVSKSGLLSAPPEDAIDAPTFAKLFGNSEWTGVNKLFIIDSCYAGGMWAGPGSKGPLYLAGLDHSAIIAAANEKYESYYSNLGQSQLSIAVEQVLDTLSPHDQLDFPTFASDVSTALAGIVTASGNGFPEDAQILGGGPSVPTADNFWSGATTDFTLDLGGTAVPEPSTSTVIYVVLFCFVLTRPRFLVRIRGSA